MNFVSSSFYYLVGSTALEEFCKNGKRNGRRRCNRGTNEMEWRFRPHQASKWNGRNYVDESKDCRCLDGKFSEGLHIYRSLRFKLFQGSFVVLLHSTVEILVVERVVEAASSRGVWVVSIGAGGARRIRGNWKNRENWGISSGNIMYYR